MPSSPNALLTLGEALNTASQITTPRLTKNCRLLSPVELQIERAANVGGATIWGASLNGRWDGNRYDLLGDGASTIYDTTLTHVAFANYNWLVKIDKSTRTGTATIAPLSNLVTGAGTAFTTELAVGDEITINGERRTVIFITSATALNVDRNFTTTAAGASVFLNDALLPVTTDWTESSNGGLARFTFTAAAKVPLNAKLEIHFVVPVAKFAFATALVTFLRREFQGADVFWYAADATATPSATNVYIVARDQ